MKTTKILAILVLALGLVSNASGQVASNPDPADGTARLETWATLSWGIGTGAVSHDVYFGENFDVYFGENFDDVNNGTGGTFQGNQTETSFTVGLAGFPYPDGLALDTTYYWRVDEFDGTATYKGDVWSFNVLSAAGLVGLWKLDETEGDIAHDIAGDNEGTLYGEPVWQPTAGQIDGALQFDGIDDYVSAELMLDTVNAVFSVFAWVKGGMPGQVVFSQARNSDWLGADTTNGSLMTELKFLGRPSRALQSQTVITDDNWHRVGLVWDGSNRILYVDNVEVAADAYDQGYLFGDLQIGAGKNLDPGTFWSGLIDDVRIYDRAITKVATEPNPANGAERVPIDTTLSWQPGLSAATHDVYFGTSSPPAFIGNQAETSYDPRPLELLTTYYWQVDAVEADGTTKYTGDIWSFTTVLVTGLKKGAYLIYPGDNTQMTVLWQLEMTYDCTLEWGTDTNYGSSATSSEYGSDHQHQYTITSLAPGAKYYYRVEVDGGYLTGSFLAAPAADAENVKFLAYGDTRSHPETHDAVNAQMIAAYTADPAYQTFTMLTGDWVANGDNESDWTDQFFDRSQQNTMEMQANLPINGCIGNHEESGIVFEKYWPYPYESGGQYWSFDYGPAHIVVLDQYTASYAPGSPQYIWLENDLANATAPWKFIQLHAPGWTAGVHENNSDVQNDIQPLCETYGVGVAAVFCGHNHYYARAMVNGVAHITAGGGGAPLYRPEDGHPNIVVHDRSNHFCKIDIQGKQLTFEAVRLDGTVIDTFTMSH
jgi:hypothetical protein